MLNHISFIIPKSLNYILIKIKEKPYIYIYNKNFFFFFSLINKKKIYLNKSTNSITIILPYPSTKMIFQKYLDNLLYSWVNFFFKKIKFTGKGYKIVYLKKKKKLKLKFNRAHRTSLFLQKIWIKKFKKKIIFYYNNHYLLSETLKKVQNVRTANLYTKRGLKLTRQIFYKKFSKKISTI